MSNLRNKLLSESISHKDVFRATANDIFKYLNIFKIYQIFKFFICIYTAAFSSQHMFEWVKSTKKETSLKILLKRETLQIKRDLKETQKVV